MIFVGNDIVEVDRINALIKSYNQSFLDKIYTPQEQQFCNCRKNPNIHFAGRFAAKEAIKKILLQISKKPIPLNKIEIIREVDSPPHIFINHKENKDIKVSISHTDNYATAVAIMDYK
jgi:holo-[acyl-carrier protein] synthase